MSGQAFCVRTSWQWQGDIEILMMGDVPVGRLKERAWIFNLAAPACFWKAERTELAARCALMLAFKVWLDRAGIAPVQGNLFA